jgi:hypothetical protein
MSSAALNRLLAALLAVQLVSGLLTLRAGMPRLTLVAPGRRGLEWMKWIASVEVA